LKDNFTTRANINGSLKSMCLKKPSKPRIAEVFLAGEGSNMMISMMTKDIRVSNTTRTVWYSEYPKREVSTQYKGTDISANLTIMDLNRSSIKYLEINCASRKYRLLSYTDYDETGDVADSSSTPSDFDFIAPDTIGDAEWEFACLLD
jgi:hypothetical protein